MRLHQLATRVRSARVLLPVAAVAAITISLAALSARDASGAPPVVLDIGAGPLDHVYVSDDLSCQVAVAGDEGMSIYPSSITPADCGTMLAVNDVLYAPDFFSHDGTSTLFLGSYTVFTPISQSAVTGSGSGS